MASWRRHWFLVSLALVSAGALAVPEGGAALRATGWALPLLTATSLVLSGIRLETAGLREGPAVMVLLLPVVVGHAAHRPFWSRLRTFLPAIVRLAQAIILLFVYTGGSAAVGHPSERPALILAFVATAASLHVALLVWNHQTATGLGLSPPNRVAV